MARQVAFAKWDARSQVEDTTREVEMITLAVIAGQSRALDREVVSNFSRAQIDANKLVQYSLLASWQREDAAPCHSPIDLAAVREKAGLLLRNHVETALEFLKKPDSTEYCATIWRTQKEVHKAFFPQENISGLTCETFHRPTRGIGGDYYDFLPLQPTVGESRLETSLARESVPP